MVSARSRVFRLGKWLVEADANRLSSGDRVQHLEPKTMAVLLYLCERPGEVVSADALIESVWGGRPLGDNPSTNPSRSCAARSEDDSQRIAVHPHRSQEGLHDSSARYAEAETPDTPARGAAAWRRYAPVAAGVVLGFAVAAAVLVAAAAAIGAHRHFTPVSTFPGAHSQPSLAPDGSRFAFVNDARRHAAYWVWDGAGETVNAANVRFGGRRPAAVVAQR